MRARSRRRPRHRRPAALLLLLKLALVGLVFAAGLALGQTLAEEDGRGGTLSYERTLKPLTLAPAPVTVTVTVTARE